MVKPKKIRKMDGSDQVYNTEKIVKSLLNAGVPDQSAKEIVEMIQDQLKDGITTQEIRNMILKELKQKNEEWYDNWIFYERIVKKRVTYELGKFVEIKQGSLYLGRDVKDVGVKGLSDPTEVQAILKELEEDLKQGLPKQKINSRTFVLYMAILKTKKMRKADKEKAIAALNDFRKKLGYKAYIPKKPL